YEQHQQVNQIWNKIMENMIKTNGLK
ncbi:hypothetical protein DBR06_SOUSAS1210083, partial [Sousa chinensis]